MFSDHLRKIQRLPRKMLWLIVGGLAIVFQLGAVALLASGQVHKAQLREMQYATERSAIANCVDSNKGAARHACIRQVKSGNLPGQAGPP